MITKIFYSLIAIALLTVSCKKNEQQTTAEVGDKLNDNTIVVTNSQMQNSLISIDSTKLVYDKNGIGVSNIKIGSILVSDITNTAPLGYLRKVVSIQSNTNQVICTTTDASLEDAVVNGKGNFKKTFTDADILGIDTSGIDIASTQRLQRPEGIESLSFNFNYDKVVYDQDGNNSTTNDQIKVEGSVEIIPELDFELEIKNKSLKKLRIQTNVKNINKIKVSAKASIINLHQEQVLKTFQLKPFTVIIAGLPIPVAKQWIVVLVGADGNISAKVTSGAENINESKVGLLYENGVLSTIKEPTNTFQLNIGEFEGNAKVEPWLQARWELRPYGLKQSRIFLAFKGSVIGEGILTPANLTITTKWGLKFSAKAQLQIFSYSLLNYERTFFEEEYPIGNPVVLPLSLQSGLVAYYPFNGNANDESGNGNNGVVQGATLTSDKNGVVNSAYFFNGTSYINGGVQIPSILHLMNSVSISAKIKVVSAADGGRILRAGCNCSQYTGYDFFVSPYGNGYQLLGQFGDGSITSNHLLNFNTWYSVVFTADVSGIRVYVDGQLVASNLNAITPPTASSYNQQPFLIGVKDLQQNNGYQNGSLDQIRIYNRVLTVPEIQSLYTNNL